MDWENPLRSIAATVDADVLAVLAVTEEAVTGNELARLAGRSYAQVYAVVHRMVAEGLVATNRYGRTNAYWLNHDHVVAQAIVRVLAAPRRIESEIRRSVGQWRPLAEMVALMGAAAHRRVTADGEIDLLLIRPSGTSRYDPGWRSQVDELVGTLEAMAGNRVRLTDVAQPEFAERSKNDSAFADLLHTGARILAGERPAV